jgi:hypothetical protein
MDTNTHDAPASNFVELSQFLTDEMREVGASLMYPSGVDGKAIAGDMFLAMLAKSPYLNRIKLSAGGDARSPSRAEIEMFADALWRCNLVGWEPMAAILELAEDALTTLYQGPLDPAILDRRGW